MEKLPKEITNNIFLHLRLREKLECMLVCRHWAKAVKASQLFHSIDMYTVDANFKNTYQLMDSVIKEPAQHAKVKHLTLESEQMGSINGERFIKAFDNLHSICLKNTKVQFQTKSAEKSTLRKGQHPITNIIEMGICSYSLYVLSSGVCDRLTSLTLLLNRAHPLDNNLFHCLSNAPNVLSLTLSNVSIKMETLELIHHSLKRLEVLDIRNMVFVATKGFKLSAKITPSPTMKTFYLDLTDELHKSHNILFNYAKRKYTNLEHFGILHSYTEIPFPDNGLYGIIDYGLVPLLEHIGHRLKTFKSPLIEETPYIVAMLEQRDCQLQSLACHNTCDTSIFDILYKAKQHKHIQHLVLKNIASDDNDLTPPFYKLLDTFTCLVQLDLDFAYDTYYRGKINFNYILDKCPASLETLSISHIFLDVDNTYKKQYRLKTLKLKSIEYEAGLDTFLSTHFKHLQHLGLENVLFYGKRFHLPHLHLTRLDIYSNNIHNHSALVVTTLDPRKKYKYEMFRASFYRDSDDLVEKYGDLVYSTTPKLANIEKINPQLHIPITFGSVKNLILNNRVAF